ncbi:MAG TPA: coenzyme F420-0:L-glutamate ligase [Micropepsaceae bacterium]|nr:coenzyme F420-0:L-glutamate ligase [Micropepsaceae bacterium]
MTRTPIQIFPLPGLPEIQPGDDLARLILGAVRMQDFRVAAGDVFVVAQKIVSKAEGRIVILDAIVPSTRAEKWAEEWGKDSRVIELVLREAKRIVRMERGVIVAETSHGFVCANAGIDLSNADEGTAILLPEDPDASARALQTRLGENLGVDIGIIISDTFGRPWREGLVNVALGVAGIAPLIDYRGERDANGKLLQATIIAMADELASAAELVMGKADRVPVAIIRGIARAGNGSGRDLIRPEARDLFR